MSKTTFLGFRGIILVSVFLAGCSRMESPQGDYYNPYKVPVDPFNFIHSAVTTETGKLEEHAQAEIPKENFKTAKFEVVRKDDDVQEEIRPASKISPVLQRMIGQMNADAKVEVIITLREGMRLPLLPDFEPGENREDSQAKRIQAIEKLKNSRSESQAKMLETLRTDRGFNAKEQFWLVNAVTTTVEVGSIVRLAESSDVVYVQPVMGGEEPPVDGDNSNDVDDGRAHIDSDAYFNLGLTDPWIGLLDTGIRNTHALFNSPSNIALMRDCVNGGTNCTDAGDPNYDPSDFAWNHGTSSAAIITGNDRLGNAFRGVTGIRLDSWQIYTASGLNSAAAIRGLEAAVALFDRVIVGELQADETESGAIATAADNAYDTGTIIVAANGNFGPAENTVRSPAIAHKVIGVGGFLVTDRSQYDNQGRGPATDGRYKPDIQTPTFSETASNTSDTDTRIFGGTSGATPYAGGVAMLVRNWLRQIGVYDNGQTYAFMILYGQDPFPYDNTEGAGDLKMATNGHARWGKVNVTNGLSIDIATDVGAGKRDLDGALWWPESASQMHNDVDLHLIDPSGTERARGFSGLSIFERAKVAGDLATGQWKFRIRGYNIRTSGQVVYWAAHIRN